MPSDLGEGPLDALLDRLEAAARQKLAADGMVEMRATEALHFCGTVRSLQDAVKKLWAERGK